MAGLVTDCQPDQEADMVGTTPRRIIVGLVAIVAVSWFFVREVDLAAYPGGNLVLGFGIFVLLLRILPH